MPNTNRTKALQNVFSMFSRLIAEAYRYYSPLHCPFMLMRMPLVILY